jgi:hypothetical protein
VVPATFSTFFAASAGVAGALIGLLFVAISVAPAPSRPEQRLQLDVRAGVAFSALTDTLVVALCALIPGVNLDGPTLAVAIAGFTSCVALGIVLVRAKEIAHRRRQLWLLAVQSAIFVYQLVIGIQILNNPHDQSPIRSLAILTLVFFLVGISRAWELIGGRDTGLLTVVRDALRQRPEPGER